MEASMGGKRSDQYAIDPGEANATDHKERIEDQRIRNEDKQEVGQTRHRDEQTMIPKAGTNPALADLQNRRAAKATEGEADDQAAVDPGHGK
jgi:hypothetical protein